MALQEVVLFIPTLTLHLCVNELHDSFSINSAGEQKGKKSKGWKLPRKSYFLHFGLPLRTDQVSETRDCPQLSHITPSLGFHTDPLRSSRHRCQHGWEDRKQRQNWVWNAHSTQTSTEVLRRTLLGDRASTRTKRLGRSLPCFCLFVTLRFNFVDQDLPDLDPQHPFSLVTTKNNNHSWPSPFRLP